MSKHDNSVPLIVDLDGSLIKTDTLFETALLYLKSRPWLFFNLLIWFFAGKQTLKQRLASFTDLNIDKLPYNQDVIAYLEDQKKNGRTIILCTGSWLDLAQAIAEKLSLFSEVIATDSTRNLTGNEKLRVLRERFDEKGFDYLGNEPKDLTVWESSRKALVVGNQGLVKRAARVSEVDRHFDVNGFNIRDLIKAIRLHQWVKNSLLFIPVLFAHKIADTQSLILITLAFLCFGLCASATYMLNDLLDLESDRKHGIKRNRPIAAGTISIPWAVMISMVMLFTGVLLALNLSIYFLWSLLTYITLTIFYSFSFKQLQTVDVIVLASLFTIRVVAGSAATGIDLSFWLLSFSMFLFLSLAIVKRVSELIRTASQFNDKLVGAEHEKIPGRGYYYSDIAILQSLGGAASFLSVLVLALYINSEDVLNMYSQPQILWLICPIMGYWVMRIWMLTARGEMNEDPISFAITDRNSWLSGVLIGAVLFVATIV